MAVKPSWESWAERKSLVLLNGQSVAPVSQVLSLLLSLLFKTKMESSSCSREKKKALTMMEKLGKLEIWINMIDKNEYNMLTYLVNEIKDFLRRFVISKLVTDLRFALQLQLWFCHGPFPNKHLVKERSNGNCIEKKADLLVNQQRMNNDRLRRLKQNMTKRKQYMQWKVT